MLLIEGSYTNGDLTDSQMVYPAFLACDTCRTPTVSSRTKSSGISTGTRQETPTLIRLMPARVTCWQSYSSILSRLWQFSRCSRVTSVMRRQLSSSSTCSLSCPHVLLLRWRIPSSVISSQWDKLWNRETNNNIPQLLKPLDSRSPLQPPSLQWLNSYKQYTAETHKSKKKETALLNKMAVLDFNFASKQAESQNTSLAKLLRPLCSLWMWEFFSNCPTQCKQLRARNNFKGWSRTWNRWVSAQGLLFHSCHGLIHTPSPCKSTQMENNHNRLICQMMISKKNKPWTFGTSGCTDKEQ